MNESTVQIDVPLDPAPGRPMGGRSEGGLRAWLWNAVGQRLLRMTFHDWYGLRRALLRAFGASVARTARIRASVRIWAPWNVTVGEESAIGDRALIIAHAPIRIGSFCTVSQYAHLCSGGYEPGDTSFRILAAPVEIGDDVWVAADTYVGPGVRVGAGAILGARTSVYRDVPAWTIVTGGSGAPAGRRPAPREADA